MTQCNLSTKIKLSDHGEKALNKIKLITDGASIGKGTLIVGSLLSFITPSKKIRNLAAKGSTDWSNVANAIGTLDKIKLRELYNTASYA